ncbi:hypothetical protein [Streptomyces geysiriensis]|uniref:hypothetical protein n=1 Tax=Streptomyces geysiriensis TaxID=68207 RepID=UPI0027E0C794|nr:hypothetical protein [Streptomyces geysiriensis]
MGAGRESGPDAAYGTRWARLNATAGYGTSWARRAAYEHGSPEEAAREDTVTLFIGRPGYEREALEADPLAVIVRRPRDRDTGVTPGAETDAVHDDATAARRAEPSEPAESAESAEPTKTPGTPEPFETAESAVPAGGAAAGGVEAGGIGPVPERLLRPALWLLLGIAAVVLLVAARELPWLGGGVTETRLTGRELLRGLPLPALVAGALLLVVFVASVTLCVATDARLPGAALGAAVLTLYAAPVALGREPEAVGGAIYTETAGFLAEAAGLDGPGPLLRWAPLVLQLLCLVPLWTLLAKAAGDRVSWQGRWGVLYLAAVAGWVWRAELALLAPPLLLLLGLAALLLSLRRPVPASTPDGTEHHPHRTRPNGTSRD